MGHALVNRAVCLSAARTQRTAVVSALLAALLLLAARDSQTAQAAAAGASRPQPKLEKGKLLVASRDLGDPNFAATVILLVAYGPNGAMGVVINRPSDVKLSKVLPSIKQLRGRGDVLYIGGPVARDHVLLLVRSAKEPADALPVFDDVYASSSLTVLRQQLERKDVKGRHLQAFAGHAGWAPGQLDAELARGDWYVVTADATTLFTTPATEVWDKLIQRVEGDWVYAPVAQPHTT